MCRCRRYQPGSLGAVHFPDRELLAILQEKIRLTAATEGAGASYAPARTQCSNIAAAREDRSAAQFQNRCRLPIF